MFCVQHCGSDNAIRLPGIWLHPSSGTDGGSYEGFHIIWSDTAGTNKFQTEYVTVGETYHLEIDVTQSWLTMTQNGVTQIDQSWPAQSTFESLPCYASDPWTTPAADVTIQNIEIWSGGTVLFLRVSS